MRIRAIFVGCWIVCVYARAYVCKIAKMVSFCQNVAIFCQKVEMYTFLLRPFCIDTQLFMFVWFAYCAEIQVIKKFSRIK